MAKVAISKNAENLIALASKVYAQHQKLATASPLSMLDWKTIGPTIEKALEEHNKAEELQRLSELSYSQRDKLLQGIEDIVKRSRDVLKGVYRDEPKKLGEFGYDVTDTVKNVKGKV